MGDKAREKSNAAGPTSTLCTLADHLVDLVYLSSSGYRLEYANQAIVDKWGKPPKNASCYKAVYGLEKVCPWCVNKEVISGETILQEIENPRDGKVYDVMNIPFMKEGSASKLTIMHDVDTPKQTDKASETSCKLKTIAELITTVSHEINNPLQVISGVAELMLESDLTPDTKESLRAIVDMTGRIQAVVNRIHEIKIPKTSSYARDVDMLDIGRTERQK